MQDCRLPHGPGIISVSLSLPGWFRKQGKTVVMASINGKASGLLSPIPVNLQPRCFTDAPSDGLRLVALTGDNRLQRKRSRPKIGVTEFEAGVTGKQSNDRQEAQVSPRCRHSGDR